MNENEEITFEKYRQHLWLKLTNNFREGFFIKNAARLMVIAGILFLSLGFLYNYLFIVGILIIVVWGCLLFRIYVNKMEKINELSKKSFKEAIFQLKQEEFFIFIKSKFLVDEQKDSNYYINTLNKLVSLDQFSLEYGIARMKHIEEKHDLKMIPYILTLIGSIVTYYKLFLDKINGSDSIASSLSMLVYTIFIAIFIARLMDESKEKTTNALYFRTLLESAKEIKKERKTATIKQQKEELEQIKEQLEHIENRQETIETRLFILNKNNK